MSRLIFIIAIVVVVYLLLKSYRQKPPTAEKPIEDMVSCTQCGINVPKSESLQVGIYYFCCAEHRDAYRR